MVRLRPEHFFRFVLLTGFISILFIGFFTVRHQVNKEKQFEEDLNIHFLFVLEEFQKTFIDSVRDDEESLIMIVGDSESSLDLSQKRSIIPQDSTTSIYLFWSPWSEKSIEILGFVDSVVAASEFQEIQFYALSVKESRQTVLEEIHQLKSILLGNVMWVEGTSLYSELAVPGVPTLIIVNAAGIFSSVGVSREDVETLVFGLTSN